MKYKINNEIHIADLKKSKPINLSNSSVKNRISHRIQASDRGVVFTNNDATTLGRYFINNMIRSNLQPFNILFGVDQDIDLNNDQSITDYNRRFTTKIASFANGRTDWAEFLHPQMKMWMNMISTSVFQLLTTHTSFKEMMKSQMMTTVIENFTKWIGDWMKRNTNPDDPNILMTQFQELTKRKGCIPSFRGQNDTSFIFYEFAPCHIPLMHGNKWASAVSNPVVANYVSMQYTAMVAKLALCNAIKKYNWKKEIIVDDYVSIIFKVIPYDYLSALDSNIDDFSLQQIFFSNVIHLRPYIKMVTSNDDHFRSQFLKKIDISLKYYQEATARCFFRGSVLQSAVGLKKPYLALYIDKVSGQRSTYTLSNGSFLNPSLDLDPVTTGAGFNFSTQKYKTKHVGTGGSDPTYEEERDYWYTTAFQFYSEDSGNTYGATMQIAQETTGKWVLVNLTNGYINLPDGTPEISSGLIPTITNIVHIGGFHNYPSFRDTNDKLHIFNLISNIDVSDQSDQFVASIPLIPKYDATDNSFKLTLDADNVKEYDSVYVLGQKI